MGVIQRQGFKNSVVQYLGAGIGMLSTLLVYNLATEVYGLIQFLKSTALLFLPLANWGIQSLTIRFFPNFRSEDGKHNGFFSFLLITASLFFLIFAGLVLLFWDNIHTYYLSRQEESPLIPSYLWYIVPLTYLLILVNLLTNYIANFQRIVIPGIVHDLFLKLVVPILILLFAFNYLSLDWVVRIFILAYVLIVCFLLIYLYFLKELQFSLPGKKIWSSLRAMADFAGFSMLGSLGGMLALQLDTFMLGSLDTEYHTGIYNQAVFIAMAIAIPQRSILSISAPLIADRWQKKDLPHIGQLYKQLSLLLSAVGLFLLLEIGFNFRDLCALIPTGEDLFKGFWVILIIGAAQVIDMGTSINGHIIQYSPKYRVNVYFILFLGGLNIILNSLLVPRFQMIGAAAATAFSLTAYNILRTLYVRYRFGIQPFSWNTFRLFIITAFTIIIAYLLPESSYPFLNIVYRGMIIAIFFTGLTYRWNISEEFNQYVDNAWKKVRSLF